VTVMPTSDITVQAMWRERMMRGRPSGLIEQG
jgi:hypothetical protein